MTKSRLHPSFFFKEQINKYQGITVSSFTKAGWQEIPYINTKMAVKKTGAHWRPFDSIFPYIKVQIKSS